MDVMVDIETLGTSPGSVVVSIGAVRFGDDGLDLEFYRAIDVFDSLMRGLSIDVATVAWWRQQSSQARAAASARDALRSLAEALDEFGQFIKGTGCIWAKGPDFDLVLLRAAYEAAGLRVPWSFRNARDVRTIVALTPHLPPFIASDKHHALGDAKTQARQVLAAYQLLGVKINAPAPEPSSARHPQ